MNTGLAATKMGEHDWSRVQQNAADEWDLRGSPGVFVQDHLLQPQSGQEKQHGVSAFIISTSKHEPLAVTACLLCMKKRCVLLNEQREEEVDELHARCCSEVFKQGRRQRTSARRAAVRRAK